MNVFWNCCENVSHVLTNDEFQKAVISGQWSVARKHQTSTDEVGRKNWPLNTDHWPLLLSCCSLLRRMPQATAFDKAIKIFSQIRSVIPGALQSLRHQKHIEA